MRCRCAKKDKGRYAICDNTKTFKKSELEEIVLKEINQQIKRYYDKSKVEKNYYDKKVNDDINSEIEILEKEKDRASIEVNKKTNLFNLLYEDRLNGVISVEEFTILKNKNSKEVEIASERIQKIDEKIKLLNKRKEIEMQSKKLFTKYKKIKKLNRMIMNEFIQKIYVGRYDENTKSRNVKIIWNIKES